MTISISSEDRRNHTSILIRAKKIAFPPKPDGHTEIRTDKSNYRVAFTPNHLSITYHKVKKTEVENITSEDSSL